MEFLLDKLQTWSIRTDALLDYYKLLEVPTSPVQIGH